MQDADVLGRMPDAKLFQPIFPDHPIQLDCHLLEDRMPARPAQESVRQARLARVQRRAAEDPWNGCDDPEGFGMGSALLRQRHGVHQG
ncbi:hypothetical protein RNZ50_00650 [Paracoccaceae bacterium Fryx2]|nr:hypothetical protein [Paracoccaceae bacterium Fryx2]